ncbi:MAG: T9SS type A sorting domain-containing protein [Bacteroidota bacterium]
MKTTLILLLLLLSQRLSSQDFWKQLTTPYAGRISAIAHDDQAKIYVGTQDNGLYSSIDSGYHWSYLGFSNNPIITLGISQKGSVILSTTSSIQRSTDGGAHWKGINNGISSTVRAIAANFPNNLFAGTDAGVYRSSDDGDSWIQINNGLIDTRILALAAGAQTFYATTYRAGVFRSYDNGDTWEQVNNGINSIRPLSIILNLYQNIFIGTESNGIFYSTDEGNSWKQVLKYGSWINFDIDPYQRLYALDLSGTVLYSSNSGTEWISVNTDTLRAPVSVISINVDNTMFTGTNGSGLYRKLPLQNNWISVGFPVTLATSFASGSDGSLVISTWNGFNFSGGCFTSVDNGESWQATSLGGYRLSCMAIQSSGTIVTGGPDGMFRSTDNGMNWTRIITGMISNQLVTVTAGSPNYFFGMIGSQGIARSSDDGISWSITGLAGMPITSLSSDSSGAIYACTPQGLFRSTDNAIHWTLLRIASIIDTTVAFQKVNNQMFVATNSFIYYSNDTGATWVPSISIDSIGTVQGFATYGNRGIFAATSKGVYHSDNGQIWNGLNAGLSTKNLFSIGFDRDGYLYVGTGDAGIFRSSQIIMSAPNHYYALPGAYFLGQNYPNPFNPVTKITFAVTELTPVTLKIYDILGRELKTLVNEVKLPGSYTVQFDASALASGIYIYSMKARRYSDQKKMLLLK